MTIPGGAGISPGAVAQVSCATGYAGVPDNVVCGDDGSWPSASGCEILDCGTPSADGYIFSTGATTFGSTATFTCAAGYAGIAQTVACGDDGNWNISGCTGPSPRADAGLLLAMAYCLPLACSFITIIAVALLLCRVQQSSLIK